MGTIHEISLYIVDKHILIVQRRAIQGFLYSSVIIEIKNIHLYFPPFFLLPTNLDQQQKKNQLICYCVPGLLGFEPGTQLWQFSLEYLVIAPLLTKTSKY